MTDFQAKVIAVVRDIPSGKVLSYKEVAEKAGFPRAYRAVGSILRKNKNSEIPCHRVVKSNRSPGGYNGGEKEKELRLISEKATFDKDRDIKYTYLRNFGGGH